ncbi:MAG TPA: hypothetical protein VGN57_11285 [Pirellulaceae bacterium]|nr:hypothetical protein [Pirellulaceae bacterium]
MLAETSPGLFIGGVPPDRLPEVQADRFFAAEICAVRLSRGGRAPSPDETDPATWKVGESTLAMFLFDEGAGTETADQAGTLNYAEWVEIS